jgi:hypothetical protein
VFAPRGPGALASGVGDYRRRLPHDSPAQIRARQEQDAVDLVRNGFAPGVKVRLHPYRCEVTADGRVQFVPFG